MIVYQTGGLGLLGSACSLFLCSWPAAAPNILHDRKTLHHCTQVYQHATENNSYHAQQLCGYCQLKCQGT